jgi:hypothetical protein
VPIGRQVQPHRPLGMGQFSGVEGKPLELAALYSLNSLAAFFV